MVGVAPDPDTMNGLTDREQAALAAMQHYRAWDSGYSKQQSTRPQTIGYGLTDSRAGLCAWIKEILRPSRRWAEKQFPNLHYWNELERTGQGWPLRRLRTTHPLHPRSPHRPPPHP
jgi:hypothetical protein